MEYKSVVVTGYCKKIYCEQNISEQLDKEVNKLLQEGWQLNGPPGVSITSCTPNNQYCIMAQALVR